MDKVTNSKLTAPGRLDAVEKVLKCDPFFMRQMEHSRGKEQRRNRRGIQKTYSGLTVEVVMVLARLGLDAARMRRDEILAKAFHYCDTRNRRAA
jgi:hypothetical protein